MVVEVRITSSRDEAVARPVLRPAGSRSTLQSVGLQSRAVRVWIVVILWSEGRCTRLRCPRLDCPHAC